MGSKEGLRGFKKKTREEGVKAKVFGPASSSSDRGRCCDGDSVVVVVMATSGDNSSHLLSLNLVSALYLPKPHPRDKTCNNGLRIIVFNCANE